MKASMIQYNFQDVHFKSVNLSTSFCWEGWRSTATRKNTVEVNKSDLCLISVGNALSDRKTRLKFRSLEKTKNCANWKLCNVQIMKSVKPWKNAH